MSGENHQLKSLLTDRLILDIDSLVNTYCMSHDTVLMMIRLFRMINLLDEEHLKRAEKELEAFRQYTKTQREKD